MECRYEGSVGNGVISTGIDIWQATFQWWLAACLVWSVGPAWSGRFPVTEEIAWVQIPYGPHMGVSPRPPPNFGCLGQGVSPPHSEMMFWLFLPTPPDDHGYQRGKITTLSGSSVVERDPDKIEVEVSITSRTTLIVGGVDGHILVDQLNREIEPSLV